MDEEDIFFMDEAFTSGFIQLKQNEENDLWALVIESNIEESLEFSDGVELIIDQNEQFFKDAQKYLAAETSKFLDGLTLDFL